MSKELYKRFISLCKKWPLDESKYSRDYGEFFRMHIKKEFPHAEHSQVKNPVEVDAAISSLERLANNNYFNENPLKRSTASGVNSVALREIVSTDKLRLLQEQEETTLIKKLKKSLNFKFNRHDNPGTKELDSENQKQSTIGSESSVQSSNQLPNSVNNVDKK